MMTFGVCCRFVFSSLNASLKAQGKRSLRPYITPFLLSLHVAVPTATEGPVSLLLHLWLVMPFLPIPTDFVGAR